jgi:hypothetical protein
MEKSFASSASTQAVGGQRDNTFGVQSLADTLEAAFGPESTTADKRIESDCNNQYQNKSKSRTVSHSSTTSSVQLLDSHKSSPARKPKKKVSSRAGSPPSVPLNLDAPSPIPTSGIPSTPSAISLQSLKLSDDDSAMEESGSQAITSSGEEEGAEPTAQQSSMGSFPQPQLVMPSIQMPSRRPFTTKGKAMGKLRVMVAGETGAYPSLHYKHRCCGMSLTMYDRPRKDVSRPFNRPTLRGYRTRRPSIPLQLVCSTDAAQIEVSKTKFWPRRNR